MSPTSRLMAAVGTAHFADQLALAALPLTAVLTLGAGPGLVGTLVAVQGAAWLIVSLPAGVLTDRVSRTKLIVGSQGVAAAAFAAAAAGAFAGVPAALAAASFLAAAGAVVMVLAAMALVPSLVPAADLPRANARLELGRAVAALLAPAAVGAIAQAATPVLGYLLAALAALVALASALGLKDAAPAAAPERPPVLQAIREGARFALGHDLLLGIVLCAVFFNFAFFALMAVIVSYAIERIGLEPTWVGAMQSGYGVGLIAGALSAGHILSRIEPRVVLIAGPGLAAAAALLLVAAPHRGGFSAGALAFFLLGFGPMLWFICQTSIRQLVTPSHLLGRVAAMIQVAIYGVRPLGALAGGWAASLVSLEAALALVLAGFALSLAVPLLSALGRLRVLPEVQAA